MDDEVLHTLKAESDRIAEKIHTLYMARESVIALVSTVAGGVLALRGTSVRFGGIVALPYLMVAIMAYAMDRANEMKALGGYRWALEERVNELLGQPCLLWESRMARCIRNTPHCQWPLRVFRLAALVVFTATALWAALDPRAFGLDLDGGSVDWRFIVVGAALYAAGVGALVALYLQGREVGCRAYRIARGESPKLGCPPKAPPCS